MSRRFSYHCGSTQAQQDDPGQMHIMSPAFAAAVCCRCMRTPLSPTDKHLHLGAVHVLQLAPLISKLSLAPGDALMLLQSEMAAGHDLQAVLDPANLDSLSRQWRALADEVKVPIAELMAALAAQLITSDSR